jgi:hypothetical protein
MSHIFFGLVSDNTPACNYIVNDHECNMGYYLADGIYPEWATLAKTIQNPENRAEAKFAKAQEAAQKDIERAFDVLQARFAIVAIVRGPSRFWDKRILHDIMTTYVILHNMIIEDEDLNLEFFFNNVGTHVKALRNQIKSKHFLKYSETLRMSALTSSSKKISFSTIGISMVVDSATIIISYSLMCDLNLFFVL